MPAPLTPQRSTGARVIASALLLLFVHASPAIAQDPTAKPELRPPLQLGDGWTTGSLTDAGIAPEPLLELITEIRADTYP